MYGNCVKKRMNNWFFSPAKLVLSLFITGYVTKSDKIIDK